jgi:chitin synthase
MANIMDLLGDYKRTVECNNDISKPYIIYQAMLMVGTILSPGTIFLMVVGAMNTVLGLDSNICLASNIVPILVFSIVCMVVKKNDHIIFLAMILSTLYALLMLAVLVAAL